MADGWESLSARTVDGQFDGRSLSLRGRTVLVSGRLGLSSAGQPAEGDCTDVAVAASCVPLSLGPKLVV